MQQYFTSVAISNTKHVAEALGVHQAIGGAIMLVGIMVARRASGPAAA